MKIVAIIPARYDSTRFPGTPLAKIDGKEMVFHVYDNVSSVVETHIATDSAQIFFGAVGSGRNAIQTSPDCNNGTERVFDALQHLSEKPDVVINIQGDEPMVKPSDIQALIKLISRPQVQIGTLATRTEAPGNNIVYVEVTSDGRCVEFDRCECMKEKTAFRHLGMYIFKYKTLEKIAGYNVKSTLEQVGWQNRGHEIYFEEVETKSIGVDTPDDLEYVEQLIKNGY